MGLIRAKVALSNPYLPDTSPIKVTALVDSGATHVSIPQRIATRLKLAEIERRRIRLADDSHRTVPYVGPLMIGFANRHAVLGALVVGKQALLGAIALEDLDLVIHPRTRKLVVNPKNPDMPGALAVASMNHTAKNSRARIVPGDS
jgi:clan AA aspartic protease